MEGNIDLITAKTAPTLPAPAYQRNVLSKILWVAPN